MLRHIPPSYFTSQAEILRVPSARRSLLIGLRHRLTFLWWCRDSSSNTIFCAKYTCSQFCNGSPDHAKTTMGKTYSKQSSLSSPHHHLSKSLDASDISCRPIEEWLNHQTGLQWHIGSVPWEYCFRTLAHTYSSRRTIHSVHHAGVAWRH